MLFYKFERIKIWKDVVHLKLSRIASAVAVSRSSYHSTIADLRKLLESQRTVCKKINNINNLDNFHQRPGV